MPISVSCPCGWTSQVADALAGKKGKCPQCQAPLVIPAAGGILPLEPIEPPAAPPRRVREEVIRTLPTPSQKEWDRPKPFPLLALLVLLRPFKTIEYAGAYLSSPTNLALSIALFLVSVGAQGYLSYLQIQQTAPPAKKAELKTSGPLVFEGQDGPRGVRRGATRGVAGTTYRVKFKLESAQGRDVLPEGETHTLSFSVTTDEKAYEGEYEATLSYRRPAWAEWEEEGENAALLMSDEAEEPADAVKVDRVTGTVNAEARFDAKKTGVYTLTVRTTDPIENGKPGVFRVHLIVNEPALQAGPPAGAKPSPIDPRKVPAVAVVLGTVIAVVIGLLFNALVVNVVGKAMGGGGQLMLLLATLALVAGVVNLADLGIWLLAAWQNAPNAGIIFHHFLAFWATILAVVVVMRTYEFEFATALWTCAAASALKMLAAFFLVKAISSFL